MIAITAGDPCGIGPEVLLKVLASGRPRGTRLVVIGDRQVLTRTGRALGLRLPAWRVLDAEAPWSDLAAPLTLLDCPSRARFRAGRASSASGRAALAYLAIAIRLWRARRVHALVTAPVTKWAITRAHGRFEGQTEYLARAMARREVVMMFVSGPLRVVILTRHVPVRTVARRLSRRGVASALRLTAEALTRRFAIAKPRVAVCGLNPHAGEAGSFGDEDRRILAPAIRDLRAAGVACDGPFAADAFFGRADVGTGRYDAVVCCYHDQGLIPFKMAAANRGCQLSLGLPIVRTSPDHGSALDIAGRGLAHPGSMRAALDLAARVARQDLATRGRC